MSKRSLALFSLASAATAAAETAELPRATIVDAAAQKRHRLLQAPTLLGTNHPNPHHATGEITYAQYQDCKADLVKADANKDSKISKEEFLAFLSYNSMHYGLQWGYAGDQQRLNDLPLDFPMLFHATACQCAFEGALFDSVDLGCCTGPNAGVMVYPGANEDGSEKVLSEAEEAYTIEFCNDAYKAYGATFHPTKSPTTPAPSSIPSGDALATEGPTASPVAEIVPPTTGGTAAPSLGPSASPVVAATTTPPTPPAVATSPPTTNGTAAPIVVTPPTLSAPPTVSPIGTAVTGAPTAGTPTVSPISGATMPPTTAGMASPPLAIGIQYGISSNCGMTAFDVMNGSQGITIKEGLIGATEATVVQVLNATYPRDGSEAVAPVQLAPPAPGRSNGVDVALGGPVGAQGQQGKSGGEQGFKEPLLAEIPEGMHGVRVRVDELPHHRNLAYVTTNDGKPHSLHYLHRQQTDQLKAHTEESDEQHHQQPHQPKQSHRALVYYTPTNPVVITDVEDVVDANCPFGINCMRVSSTVYLTLEEGDDPVEVEAAIRNGIQASFADASFFEAIPEGTVFCPPAEPTTAAPTVPPAAASTPAPTRSPVAVPSTPAPTPLPTPLPVATTTVPPTASPVAQAPEPTNYPTWMPTTMFPTSLPSEATGDGDEGGPIEVSQTYDISNNCGWDAEAVMNPVDGNTLKEGLIEATRTITIGILNETYPRADAPARRTNVRAPGLAYLRAPPSSKRQAEVYGRDLAYYTDEYPVTIDRVLDIETGCAPGTNCLLVVSTITVVLEPGDDPAEVYDAISEGIKASFVDGTFFAAVPEESANCPTR